MSDEKKKEEEIKQEVVDPIVEKPKEEIKQEVVDPINAAKNIVTELKKENDRFEKNLKEYKQFAAEELIAGRSFAGQQRTETIDEKWARDAKKRYEGTGIDPT